MILRNEKIQLNFRKIRRKLNIHDRTQIQKMDNDNNETLSHCDDIHRDIMDPTQQVFSGSEVSKTKVADKIQETIKTTQEQGKRT